MLQSSRPRHYLAQFYPGNEVPEAYRTVNLVARAAYPAPGMKALHSLQVRIVRLNEGGAVLQSRALDYLPDHFYLCLGEKEIVLTCAKKSIERGSMVVNFSKREERTFIDALARINFPLTTLKRLRDACSPEIDRRINRGFAGH